MNNVVNVLVCKNIQLFFNIQYNQFYGKHEREDHVFEAHF